MDRILFARIGWMKYYSGSQAGDEKPIGGGSYNVEDVGGEINNFREKDGKVYGGFSLAHRSQRLKLEKIDPAIDAERLDNVLLIFIARDPRPNSLGQIVVGWYSNATVYSWYKMKPWWHIGETKIKNAVLLPTENRVCVVPHGENAPGQANNYYVIDSNGKFKKLSWLKSVLDFVKSYQGSNLVSNPEAEIEPEILTQAESNRVVSMVQGIAIDTGTRKVIENIAMNSAVRHYKKEGYKIVDVSSRCSYDLHCVKRKKQLFIEVKGTQTSLSSIT